MLDFFQPINELSQPMIHKILKYYFFHQPKDFYQIF